MQWGMHSSNMLVSNNKKIMLSKKIFLGSIVEFKKESYLCVGHQS